MAIGNKLVFQGLHIIAWILFVGLSIQTGGLIVNFFFSIYNPGSVQYLYQKLDLSDLYISSPWAFYGICGLILTVAVLKTYLFYIVIMLMHKIDRSNPFSSFVSRQITRISVITLRIGVISLVARQVARYLQEHEFTTARMDTFLTDSQAFILMAAVVYIIAVIFRKGVELQNENNLTV